jgi:hypothetical protein
MDVNANGGELMVLEKFNLKLHLSRNKNRPITAAMEALPETRA